MILICDYYIITLSVNFWNKLYYIVLKMTQIIKDEFIKRIDITNTYNLNDLKKILTDVFNEVKTKETKKPRVRRERDDNGDIIKKRPVSAYNIFMKEQMTKIKEANPDIDSKTIFKMAIDEWNKKKEKENTDSNNDVDKSADIDKNTKEENDSDHEEEHVKTKKVIKMKAGAKK